MWHVRKLSHYEKTVREYLHDLLQELDDVRDFTAEGKTALQDVKTRKAVIRSYEVVGEIVKRLPETFRDENPQIDWRKLAGFRNYLAHNYDEIILEFVWDAVEDLPNLRAAVQSILDDLPEEDGDDA